MSTKNILIAGFGGQGVLFAGKFLAYAGLLLDQQVSWLPSYGPEMRGGTANCSVILSDTAVGSPIVSAPDVLIAMNLPSFQKYQPAVQPGGVILMDSTLIGEAPSRSDVTVYAVPATQMASDAGLTSLSNMILVGKLLRECLPALDTVRDDALRKVVPPKKAHLIEANQRAIALGSAFEG
ncbi:MAG: 2-oxoacid:acceptor oxidoreductase family protein [bacterium]|nr:2-oxoacid:acceptor oxidoreductase family protein [bacterium]